MTQTCKTCPNCGDTVTGQLLNTGMSDRATGRDDRCSCRRIRLIDGEFYERIEDRDR